MAAKATSSAQQTTRSGQLAMTTFNGQKKKMKNLTVFKTVLAPNAPWPKWETQFVKTKEWRKPRPPAPKLNLESLNFDYFKETREELNQSKIATKSRIRDKLSGRFTGN